MGKVTKMEITLDEAELNNKTLEKVINDSFAQMAEGGMLVITRGASKPNRFDADRFLSKLTGGEGRLRKIIDAFLAAPGYRIKIDELRAVGLKPGLSPSPYRISGQLSSITRNVLNAKGERNWFTWDKVNDEWYYSLKPSFAEALKSVK